MSAAWNAGDPEPTATALQKVTDRTGQPWLRSTPNGLWWYPATGGIIRRWPELLALHGPVAGMLLAEQGALFEMAVS